MAYKFAEKLKEIRVQSGFTQSQVAKKANVSKAAISAYENGFRQPSHETLVRFASIFKVSTDYLLGVTRDRVIDVSHLTDQDVVLVQGLIKALAEKNGRISELSGLVGLGDQREH